MPGPPADFSSRKVTPVEFDAVIFRTHNITRNPIFFGRSGLHRFDAPDRSYGVLYAGRDAHCAFVESFVKSGSRIITTTELESRALAELKPSKPLRLIDLTQSGTLMRIGADARLFAGDHDVAQLWSMAFHEHPSRPDGLLYPSRLDQMRQAIALFGDRSLKIVELSRQSWYAPGAQRHLLAEVIDHYDLQLIENRFVAPRKPAASSSSRTGELF